MIWVCSACGFENSVNVFQCKECKAEYGKHQNSKIRVKLESLQKTSSLEYAKPESIDISKVDWGRPVESIVGQLAPVQGVSIPFSIKIASVVALACMFFSVLLMLK
jgi:hypothetical protein